VTPFTLTSDPRRGARRRAQAARTTVPEAPYRPSRWHWAICYLAYAGVLYACYQAFWMWRSTLEGVLAARLPDREWFPPAYLGATALVGVVIFSTVVWSEGHLRGSLPTSYYRLGSYVLRLTWRMVHVTVVMALLFGAAVLLQEWTIQSLT
jgi:hypothetical protein